MAIGSINLNRFRGTTQRYLQSNNQLNMQLFSISGNQTQVSSTGRNSLNANSQFTIPATDFSGEYQVNQQPNQASLFERGNYVSIRSDQRFLRNPAPIETRPATEAQNFQRPLSMNFSGDNSRFRPVFNNEVPAVAPETPTRQDFQDRLQYYEISDANFTALKNGPDFLIPRNGPLGFKVLTDGAGNITGIETDVARFANQFDASRNNSGLLANRADITQGAQFTALPIEAREIFGRDPNKANPAQQQGQFALQDLILQQLANRQLDLNGLKLDPNLFNADLGPVQNNNPFFQNANNPFVDRLAQLQPQEQGLAVAGPESEVDVNTAKQIAASKAKLDINLSDSFSRNLKGLQNAALQQGLVYSPAKHAAELTGMVPMAPNMPSPAKGGGETANLVNLAADLGAAFNPDAMDKKGSGGYLPFSMGGGNEGGDGQGFGQQQQQQHQNQQQQQQQQQQRRFSYNA